MELEIVDRASIGRERWDAFVGESEEAWLWHCFALQDALSTWRNRLDLSFGILDPNSGGALIAVMPLHLLAHHSLDSLGGPAFSNKTPSKLRGKTLTFLREHLIGLAKRHGLPEINISLPAMAPAYSGERCPRVNPLLELGCENSLTQTWVVDLRAGADSVWNAMEGRARTAVRKAMKNDILVREGRRDDLDIYYALHCETYERTSVPPHPKDYFEEIWNEFLLKGLAVVLLAQHKGEVVAAENFGIFKKRAVYWTGAASRKGLELEANSLIQWTAVQWLILNRFDYYEVGEAFPNVWSGKLRGLNDFKKSFGGDLYPLYRGRINLGLLGETNFSSRDGRCDLLKAWLKVTKRLMQPYIGERCTATVERSLRIGNRIRVADDKSVWARNLLKKKVGFIKPFWSQKEIEIGTRKREIDEKTALARFTEKFNKVIGIDDWLTIPTSSGRTAIELALRVLKSRYPSRKEVIIPSYGCRGVFDPVVNAGLIPLFVDVTCDLLPDGKKMIQLFSEKVLACLIVNLTGKKMDSGEVISEANKMGITSIEDNCQYTCHWGSADTANSEADILVYSFGIGKNVMASGGGALCTRTLQDEFLQEAQRLRVPRIEEGAHRFGYLYATYYRNQEKRGSYDFQKIVDTIYQYAWMNPMDAEILIHQMDKLDMIISLRQRNAHALTAVLKQYPDLYCMQNPEGHVYTKLSVRFLNQKRFNQFTRFMGLCRLELENMYLPLHLRPFGRRYPYQSLEVTEEIYPMVINVPVRPNLKSSELSRLRGAIVSFGERYGKKSS